MDLNSYTHGELESRSCLWMLEWAEFLNQNNSASEMFRCFPKFPIHFFFSTGKQFGLVSFPAAPRAQSGIPSPLPRLRRRPSCSRCRSCSPSAPAAAGTSGGLWRSRASRGRWCGRCSCRTSTSAPSTRSAPPTSAATWATRSPWWTPRSSSSPAISPVGFLPSSFACGWNFCLVNLRGVQIWF